MKCNELRHILLPSSLIFTASVALNAQPNPLPAFPACLGAQTDMQIIRQAPYARLSVAGVPSLFLVDTGTSFSQLDTNAFPETARPKSNGSTNGSGISIFDHFVFGQDLGPKALQFQTFSDVDMGDSKQLQQGLVGTDTFFAGHLTFDFTHHAFYLATSNTGFCTEQQLRDAGFLPASTLGYFGPLDNQHVDNRFLVNIPTLAIRVAGVPATAQLDSGYGDYLFGPTLNINQALYSLLVQSGVRLQEKHLEPPLKLTKCGATTEKSVPYESLTSVPFEVLGVDGKPIFTQKAVTLILKYAPEGTDTCGGIGAWKLPAAQVGNSNLIQAGRVVFDGANSLVWFQQPPQGVLPLATPR